MAVTLCCRQCTPGRADANSLPSHLGGTDTDRNTSPSLNASCSTFLLSAGVKSRRAVPSETCDKTPEPPRDQQSSAAKSPGSRANSWDARAASTGNWSVPTADHRPVVGNGKCDRGQLDGTSVSMMDATRRRTETSAFVAGRNGASLERVGMDTATVGTPATAARRAARVVLAPLASSPRQVSLATPTTHSTGASPKHRARPCVGSVDTTAASSPEAPTRRKHPSHAGTRSS